MRGLRTACWRLVFALFVTVTSGVARAEERGLLVVTVQGTDGNAVDHVAIDVYVNDEFVFTEATDLTGTAYVPAPLVPYRLIVSKGSYYTQSFDVSSPSFHDSVLFTLVEIPAPPWLADAIDTSDPSIVPIRTGFVSGRVLSATGRPVEGVTVQAVNPFEGSGGGRTGRDGTFIIPVSLSRLPAIPVKVTAYPPAPPFQSAGRAVDVVDVFQQSAYPEEVLVEAGVITPGIDIWLKSQPYYTVTVHVGLASGYVPPFTQVFVDGKQDEQGGVRATSAAQLDVPESGTVQVGPLPPGSYAIWATAGGRSNVPYRVTKEFTYIDYDGSRRYAAAAAPFTIGDRAPSDISLMLQAAARISGRVIFNDPSTSLTVSITPRVRMLAAGARTLIGYADPNDPNGRVATDGSFVFEGMTGAACVILESVPAGWHVESVTRGSTSIKNVAVELAPGDEIAGVLFTLARNTEHRSPEDRCPER